MYSLKTQKARQFISEALFENNRFEDFELF